MYSQHVFGLEILHRLTEIIDRWAGEHGLDSLSVPVGSDSSPRTLLSICDRLANKADEWPNEKLFMRIGYVQGVMVAHKICSLGEIRKAIQEAKADHKDYIDLLDHNDPDSPFYFEIGGEG